MIKNKKGATLTINTVIIFAIAILVAVVLFFLVFGVPNQIQALFGREELPPGHDSIYMNIMKTEPPVYVGSGWTCRKNNLKKDENEELWVTLYFDRIVLKEEFESKVTIYIDGTGGAVCPSREDQWVDYQKLVDGRLNILGEHLYGDDFQWPEIRFEISDDGRSAIIGPFTRVTPRRTVFTPIRFTRDFYYMIRFDTDGKSREKSFTSKPEHGGYFIMNPSHNAVMFRTTGK